MLLLPSLSGGEREEAQQPRNSPRALHQTAWHKSPSSYLSYDKATRHVGPRHPVSALGKNFLLPLSPCSLATLRFYSPSMASYNNTNCCILSLHSSHKQENQRNSSWTEWICRGICWQAYLRPRYAPGWGQEVEAGGGQAPFLLFSIYVLRFQDTWKGFAPFLLIGYRPQGSLLIYKSPNKLFSFPTGAYLHISKNTGETDSPSNGDLG